MKLQTKLTLFITGSKMLIVLLFVALLPRLVSTVGSRYTNYYLQQQQKKVMTVIQKNGTDYYLEGDSSYGSYTMLKEEYISLFPAAAGQAADTITTEQRVVEGDTINYRVLTHLLKNGARPYVLEIGKTTAVIGEYNNLLQRFTLYVLMALIAVSIVVDLICTWLLLRPLGQIVKTKLTGRKFPFSEALAPVRTTTADFRILDSSLISLMEKIHSAFEKEREFTSNASHELLTPVGILQTHAENLLMDDNLAEVQQQKVAAMMKTLSRLKKIVQSLLLISRIDNDQFTKTDNAGLHDLISEVSDELMQRMEAKSLTFTNDVSSGIYLTGINRDLLFQLFYNIINNAIRYNKDGGSIKITGAPQPDRSYRIIINDTGAGIRKADLENIFNRFKRSGHTDGEGYGLGLSIVKSIADYHQVPVRLLPAAGGGTDAELIIPAAFVN